jgi:rfaE bifunctional protein nucleotidyltransferase chain/domain/rfaE bifunctional protein kinase chain/domain
VRRPIVVVGDVLLDVDVEARADRLVPDAPVPVLDEVARRYRPGGAALAAALAARASARPVQLVAPLPDDEEGSRLRELLPPEVELIAIPCDGRTAVKTRLRARGQTVARLDQGAGPVTVRALPKSAGAALHGAAALLVSDYGGGATGCEPLRELLAARAARASTVWDPHPRGGAPVPGVTVVTPNAGEAASAAPQITGDGVAAIRRRAEALLAAWRARSVAVTLGSRGALLSYGDGTSEMFPAPAAAGDPCGAGDCFAANVTAALADGAVPSEAVSTAVAAATSFVASGGAAGFGHEAAAPGPARPARPAEPWHQHAVAVAADVRARGGTVVATGGCFDLLHAGHIATLTAARSLGDCLIICLNSDDSVRRLKGTNRPLQPVADRARVLASLRDVDAVTVFDEDTPADVLRALRPDIWVKGGDYAGTELPEAELLRQWGGELVTVPYLNGRSTSELVQLAKR